MPTSRKRKPKHKRPVSRRNDSVLAGSSTGTFAPGFDGPGWRKAMSALDNPELPPDLLVVSIVPILWTGVMRGEDVTMGAGAHVRCYGKGRKERCTPLSRETADVVRAWMRTRDGRPQDPLFPSRGSLRCLSRSAIARLVAKHASAASDRCPSLADKRPTPHTLRHTWHMRRFDSDV